MIFIFIGLIIITLVFFIVNVKKYQYDYMPISIFTMCLVPLSVGIIGLGTLLFVYNNSDTHIQKYKSTISTEEYNIDKYDELRTTTDDNKANISYTYIVKNTDNKKTVSVKDDNVYSISASSSSSRVNHLTIKHNTYFNWAIFTTTQKDEYIFSSK